MAARSKRHVVVVDGSNLATEGRTVPNLAQLDEAVRAYAEEDPQAEIVVVVDASFEHRIDASERAQLVEAELHGEVVSPPAGAIGRGDAFVLRIAERTGARVLSNDSFQEFHAEHPWLFDEGRLVGGKPVPGVGWIFTPRLPVRGPKSRQVTGKARRAAAELSAGELSPPVKAAELAKAAKRAAARKAPPLPPGVTPQVGDTWTALASGNGHEPGVASEAVSEAAVVEPAVASEVDGAGRVVAEKKVPAKKAAAKKAPSKKAAATKTAARKAAATKTAVTKPAPKAPAERAAATKLAGQMVPAKKAAAKKAPAEKAPAEKAPAKKAAATKTAVTKPAAKKATAKRAAATETAVTKPAAKKATGPRAAREDPAVRVAIDQAVAEALAPPRPPEDSKKTGTKKGKEPAARKAHAGKGSGKDAGKESGKDAGKDSGKGKRRRRRSTEPPPAVNEPLAFITFVATYPLQSEVEGEIVSFTSHGAMVDVDLPDGGLLHCYIPLTAMGDPPPPKARLVLSRGQRRRFVLVGLDPPRRVAELALPGAPGVPPAVVATGAAGRA